MKKMLSVFLASTLLLATQVSCSSGDSGDITMPPNSASETAVGNTISLTPSDSPITLRVVTSFGGSDGNSQNYEKAYDNFARVTGHTILDSSVSITDSWKQEIRTDFQTGSEPDVLYFYAGSDADPFILADKVVSLEEIRKKYPDYGSNMKEELLPLSTVNEEKYVVPVNGYWVALFTNQTILQEFDMEIPESGYQWDSFLADCQQLKDAGYSPLAISLGSQPEYILEFLLLNNGTIDSLNRLPLSLSDEMATKWVQALDDLKYLYDLGFFPEDTLTATPEEMNQRMADQEAVFQIQGSWNLDWYNENTNPEDFLITYVPAKGYRAPSDIIGGITMGYYITRVAWDDPTRQKAAVDFVTSMTRDSVVSSFGVTSLNALENPVSLPTNLSSLNRSAVLMMEGASSISMAMQDVLPLEQRTILCQGVVDLVTERKSSWEIVTEIVESLEITT